MRKKDITADLISNTNRLKIRVWYPFAVLKERYSDDSVGVKLTVKYLLKGQCSYCLNDAQKFIEKTFDILFVTEDDRENYIYDGISINLKTAVDDAILFSQPNILLCREDCTGIDINNK